MHKFQCSLDKSSHLPIDLVKGCPYTRDHQLDLSSSVESNEDPIQVAWNSMLLIVRDLIVCLPLSEDEYNKMEHRDFYEKHFPRIWSNHENIGTLTIVTTES